MKTMRDIINIVINEGEVVDLASSRKKRDAADLTKNRAMRRQAPCASFWGPSYKAKRAGVPVCFVDPRNTSRECRACGCTDKKNRPNQATFKCIGCGHEAPADINAARNI